MPYETKNTRVKATQMKVLDTSTNTSNVYTILEYPSADSNGALGSPRYPHYTMFYINDNSSSRIASNKDNVNSVNTGLNTANQSVPSSIRSGANTIKNGAANVVDVSNKALQSVAGDSAGAATVTGFAAEKVGIVADKFRDMLRGDFSRPTKRLRKVICLPMPHQIRANYRADYTLTEELGAFGSVILSAINGNGSDALETALLGIAPAAASIVTDKIKKVVENVAGKNVANATIGNGLSASAVQEIASKLSGRVINKRQEQLFNNMSFRSHNFTYTFLPRNKIESDKINEIIMQFKTFMHPELGQGVGSSILITPAEFDIEFRYNHQVGDVSDDNRNTALHRIATCALTSFDVDYTGVGEFIAFEGTPNPVAITINMVFTELEPITRNFVELGY